MNLIRDIRTAACIVAGLAMVRRAVGLLAGFSALVTTGSAALAAFQRPDPPWQVYLRPTGSFKHTPVPAPGRVHVALDSGIAGWQLALITVSVAGLAAAAILLVRALAARQH